MFPRSGLLATSVERWRIRERCEDQGYLVHAARDALAEFVRHVVHAARGAPV